VLATLIAAMLVLVVVALCNYRQIETLGVAFGLFELTFVFTMIYLHPSPMDVMKGSFVWHNDFDYHKLIAANVGAVIMPWMIYFQQSAVVARKIHGQQEFEEERKYTFLGSVLTQLIMIGALVTLAATPNVRSLETVADIQYALAPVFGEFLAKLLLSMALVGGSLCAAFVVALAAAWAICEALEVDDAFALDRRPSEAMDTIMAHVHARLD
jgi:Mn2+/Fe2+ NRAMP family transporter